MSKAVENSRREARDTGLLHEAETGQETRQTVRESQGQSKGSFPSIPMQSSHLEGNDARVCIKNS